MAVPKIHHCSVQALPQAKQIMEAPLAPWQKLFGHRTLINFQTEILSDTLISKTSLVIKKWSANCSFWSPSDSAGKMWPEPVAECMIDESIAPPRRHKHPGAAQLPRLQVFSPSFFLSFLFFSILFYAFLCFSQMFSRRKGTNSSCKMCTSKGLLTPARWRVQSWTTTATRQVDAQEFLFTDSVVFSSLQ